jgi:hypothetical protein
MVLPEVARGVVGVESEVDPVDETGVYSPGLGLTDTRFDIGGAGAAADVGVINVPTVLVDV